MERGKSFDFYILLMSMETLRDWSRDRDLEETSMESTRGVCTIDKRTRQEVEILKGRENTKYCNN